MKILVCGDLHCKPYLLQRALGCCKWDYFVFLGDACDNFGATQEDNIEIIQLFIDTKLKYGDKFIWLIGNHDWGYYDTSITMTGHINAGSANVQQLLKNSRDLWEIYWQKGKYLFSHAGLSYDFATAYDKIKYSDMKNTPGLNNPLNKVGYACGGASPIPSPLWARPKEVVPLPASMGLVQIVGHTPTPEILKSDNGLILCDTMSQYPNGEYFGDLSLLLIDGDITKGATLKAINPATGRKRYEIN